MCSVNIKKKFVVYGGAPVLEDLFRTTHLQNLTSPLAVATLRIRSIFSVDGTDQQGCENGEPLPVYFLVYLYLPREDKFGCQSVAVFLIVNQYISRREVEFSNLLFTYTILISFVLG